MTFTIEQYNTREEWLQGRSNSLGGSDAGTILGLNPFKSNYQLWQEKIGEVDAPDLSENASVQYGIAAEAYLAELFKLDYPHMTVTLSDNCIYRRNDTKWLTYSPDGILEDENGKSGILEIKTTTIRNGSQFEIWNDQIPQTYFSQLLHGFLVTDYDFAILKVLIKLSWDDTRQEIRHYYFKKNDYFEDIKYLFEEEEKFHRCIKSKTPPAIKLPTI